jgi:hypothetical protein
MKKMEIQEAVSLWKELNVHHCNCTFYCGGDAMGDTDFTLFDAEDNTIHSDELIGYLDNEMYNRVDFYVNSDGHYIGESGTVNIELNEDGDDFYFMKSAEAEFNESIESQCIIALSDDEIKFISENVSSIFGGHDERTTLFYKKDFILTDEKVKLIESIIEKIEETTSNFEPEIYDGQLEEWYRFNEGDDNEIIINGNDIKLFIQNNYTTFRDSE